MRREVNYDKGIIRRNKSYPADDLNVVIRKMLTTGIGAESERITPLIFGDQVNPACDIRFDKWEAIQNLVNNAEQAMSDKRLAQLTKELAAKHQSIEEAKAAGGNLSAEEKK